MVWQNQFSTYVCGRMFNTIPLCRCFNTAGGYNMPNTARYWTFLTSVICGKPIGDDIPDNEFFLDYGPGYELNILPGAIQDRNTEPEFELIFQRIQGAWPLCILYLHIMFALYTIVSFSFCRKSQKIQCL